MITKKTKATIPNKNNHKWNSPEIITPRTIIDNTYSAVFVNILTKRFFSLSLNFKLVLFYDQIIKEVKNYKKGNRGL